MFESGDEAPRVFALPPGADFPARLVDGLIARMQGHAPEAMARVTLYLNTSRMERRVRALLQAQGARILPRIRLVTDLGRDPLVGLAPAVPGLRRRLEIVELVRGLLDRMPDFAPGTPAWGLADSLARLMEEMAGEGVAPAALEDAGLAENHAAHWERSLIFLRIVGHYLAEDAAPDAETRQRRAVEALTGRWATQPACDPVIVAGSTGSRGATALFMQAVAGLPQGAVVLPGFDFDMPESGWNSLCSGPTPAEDHPQYRFLALTRALGMRPTDVRFWSPDAAPDGARNRLLSLALRPAPATDRWMAEGADLGDLRTATQGLSLIEADTPRAEANALALCLRQAVAEGRRAALVTPDRTLARRVTAALDRWGIVPDDSAGQPLNQTAPGRFLRQVAELFGRKLTADALLALLKHPLTATGGGERGNHLRFSRDLELHVRRNGAPFPTGADLRSWAATAGEKDRAVWADWLAEALADLEAVTPCPLADHVARHLALAQALAAGPGGSVEASELWRDGPGRAARETLADLEREAAHGGAYTPSQYADLLAGLLSSEMVRAIQGHPLVAIWGTLEARVQGADLVLLGGLNEGTWPELAPPDPWLSRQMRQRVGLLLPERRIGLSAHDFQQAAAAPEVVLSRARRDDEAETVASRWIERLTNLLAGLPANQGLLALHDMQARGQRLAARAVALDHHGKAKPAHRPAPRPPVEVRPRELPVTAIRTLIRDPYAIYASRILRLRKLKPLRANPDARSRGDALHDIVEAFVRARPPGEDLGAAHARLLQTADRILGAQVPWPATRRFWRARLDAIATRFVTAEAHRASQAVPVILETAHSLTLHEPVFTLTAKPDRIDLLADGQVHIYDYKSGKPPTAAQEESFEKQLLLEALMAERGAFGHLGPRSVAAATYLALNPSHDDRDMPVDADTLTKTWDDFLKLIRAYGRRETGYRARRAVFETRFEGDYDHLARFGEWDMSAPTSPEDVG